MDLSNNLLIVKDSSKRNRKSNAIKLPLGITENMIPKYVVYYKECYNKEKQLYREFFKIEKNPKTKSNKIYTSSKSNKVSILDKLEQIKTILLDIENREIDNEISSVVPSSLNIQEFVLPKYISLKQTDSKHSFIYDKKSGENRKTIKMICNGHLTVTQNLELFLEKIEEKYKTV